MRYPSVGCLLLVASAPQYAGAAEVGSAGADWGLTKEAAVEVCEPEGERQYLARLVCPDGAHPTFSRTGNVGPRTPLPENMSEADVADLLSAAEERRELEPGEADKHWIDAYEVICGSDMTVVYMDMYHCSTPAPAVAPAGFTIQL